ncbi:zinc finger protein 761-like [Anopheles maculipalpis]|uniref:zinc finger protein 761-like n=1 Tax=Anopheles maculipalpis TaxID=1496333 RepID=UPI002158A69E|nr:zinc finger protein 761-like [Anopheles maculipalpis]
MQCRVCLKRCENQEDGKTATLFHSFLDGVLIGEYLNDVFDLQISEDDCFPQHICEQCRLELQIVSIFRERLLLSDNTLRGLHRLGDGATTYGETMVDESVVSCAATATTRESMEQDSTVTEIATNRCGDCGKKMYEIEPTYLFQQTSPSCSITHIMLCQECYHAMSTGHSEKTEADIHKAGTATNLNSPSLTIDLIPTETSNTCTKTSRFCCVTHCSELFSDEPTLVQHAQETHAIKIRKNRENQAPGRPFKCNVCFRAFGSSKNLRIHQLVRSNVHARSFICTICPFRASNTAALTIHERSHTGERPYGCESCEKRFSSEATLKSHQVCHLDERPYECTYCSKTFARKRNMQEHAALCQSDEKPYHCEECSARFKTKQHLRLHRRLHTGEKPYRCSVCPKTFHYISDRKRHELSHAGAKPYRCHTCDASYTRKYALTMHERTHTGEQPFGCEECGKRFSKSSLLKRHVARQSCGGKSNTKKQPIDCGNFFIGHNHQLST